jgi:hypothetical protein
MFSFYISIIFLSRVRIASQNFSFGKATLNHTNFTNEKGNSMQTFLWFEQTHMAPGAGWGE